MALEAEEDGVSALEMLVALLLLGVLFTISLPALGNFARILKQVQSDEEQTANAELALRAVSSAIGRSQTVSAIPSVKINSEGANDAVSVLTLHGALPLRVRALTQQSNNGYALTLCLERNNITPEQRATIRATELFLGIGIDGVVWLRGKLGSFQSNMCAPGAPFVGTLDVVANGPEPFDDLPTVIRDMTVHTAAPALSPHEISSRLRTIIPVEDIYTLRVEGRILRRVSALTSENQPVVSGIEQLRLRFLDESELEQVFSVEVTPSATSGQSIALTETVVFRRGNPREHIANWLW